MTTELIVILILIGISIVEGICLRVVISAKQVGYIHVIKDNGMTQFYLEINHTEDIVNRKYITLKVLKDKNSHN